MMTTGIDPERLGEAVRMIRKVRKLGLKDVADKMGVSEPYVSLIENGKRKLSQDQFNQLAKALQVEVWCLAFLGVPAPKQRNGRLKEIADSLFEVIMAEITSEEAKRWK